MESTQIQPRGEGFGPDRRLQRPEQFHHVFQQRRSVADEVLIIYGSINDCSQGRLGLSVSKKVGKAHERNRWKRLIREVFRRNALATLGLDLIVIPRRGADCRYSAIADSLPRLAQRLQKKLRKPK